MTYAIAELEPLPPNVPLPKIYSDYMVYLIQHTKQRLLDATGCDLWTQYKDTADIILTHPNSWASKEHLFLREAAIDAGLVSRARAEGSLHFVQEAEAASRYCVSKYASVFGQLKVCSSLSRDNRDVKETPNQ